MSSLNSDVLIAPLSTALKEALAEAGLTSSSHLQGLRVADVARALKTSSEDAAGYKREIDAAFGFASGRGRGSIKLLEGTSALDLIDQKVSMPGIATFCRELDELLTNGIPLGEVTEICGVPGIGKTQLCMQIALDVQIPTELGGVEGATAYVDTEGSVMPARLEQMAQAVNTHCVALAKRRFPTNEVLLRKVESTVTVEALLNNILVFRCTDLAEQNATIFNMVPFLESHPSVKCLIIDSLAFHYRYMEADMAARARNLQSVAAQLHRVAASYNVAVVIINQMTTKLDGGESASLEGALADGTLAACLTRGGSRPDTSSSGGGSRTRLVPALGEAWAHACTNRVLLGWAPTPGGGFTRMAQLVKSPSRAPGFAAYAVTADGIRSTKAGPTARAHPPPTTSTSDATTTTTPTATATATSDRAGGDSGGVWPQAGVSGPVTATGTARASAACGEGALGVGAISHPLAAHGPSLVSAAHYTSNVSAAQSYTSTGTGWGGRLTSALAGATASDDPLDDETMLQQLELPPEPAKPVPLTATIGGASGHVSGVKRKHDTNVPPPELIEGSRSRTRTRRTSGT